MPYEVNFMSKKTGAMLVEPQWFSEFLVALLYWKFEHPEYRAFCPTIKIPK